MDDPLTPMKPIFRGVHPAMTVAVNAYLVAAKFEVRALQHPKLALGFRRRADASRERGIIALFHVTGATAPPSLQASS